MASWKIFSYPNNPRVWKALIAAEYTGVVIEYPPFKIGTDNKSKEFLAKNPNGKVPVLETPEGCIWESNAIARFVAKQPNSKIYGNSVYEDALIDQWVDFASNEIELPSAAWLFPILKIVPFHKEATGKAKGDIRKALQLLNTHLNTRTYLVGERISLADIVVSMVLYRLYKMVFDPGFRKGFSNVNRWYLTLVNQPQFKKVIGKVELCTKMMVAAPSAAPAKKQKQQKQQQKKKQQKKPAQPQQKKKAKNPLDALPKSSMDLEEWKRVYSNAADTKKGAMPWFWENFDAEGYSLFLETYKFNEEFEKLFMISNFCGGYLQRCEASRKYAFGNCLIFGDEEKKEFEVSSVWLLRGKSDEPPQVFMDNPMTEQFVRRKLDPANAADKELVEDYFAWEGKFGNGKKFLAGKTFK